jgi:hypothetical protein
MQSVFGDLIVAVQFRVGFLLFEIEKDLILTRLVNTSFKIALRTSFAIWFAM